jgi:predicted  nucleic acid-binding Zn-ribbon protein
MPHECTECGRAFADGSKEMLSGCPDCGGTTFQFRPEAAPPDDPGETPPDPPGPDVDGVARTVGNAASAVRNLVSGSRRPADRSGANGRDGGADERPDSAADGTAGPRVAGSGATEETADSPAVDESDPETGGDETDGSAVAETEPDTPDGTTTEPAVTENGVTETDTPVSDTARSGEESATVGKDSGPTASPEGERDAQSEARRDIVEADAPPENPPDRPPVPDPRPISARSEETAEEDDETVPRDDNGERPSLSELRAELNDQFESIRVVAPGQYELNLMELYDREEYIVALREDGKYTIQMPERWDER